MKVHRSVAKTVVMTVAWMVDRSVRKMVECLVVYLVETMELR